MLEGNEGESKKGKSDRGLGREEERVFGRKMMEDRGWKIEEVDIMRERGEFKG